MFSNTLVRALTIIAIILVILIFALTAHAQVKSDYYVYPTPPSFCTSDPVPAWPEEVWCDAETNLRYQVYICLADYPPSNLRSFDWVVGSCGTVDPTLPAPSITPTLRPTANPTPTPTFSRPPILIGYELFVPLISGSNIQYGPPPIP